jgi:D-glycero-alpha-D-manno-heptose 1-phosphate guanylyltransferase
MEAIILAGGLGTRLRSAIQDIPKPMAPVSGKPFLFYILRWVSEYNPGRIVLSIGYKSETIREYFGQSFEGIPIEYAVEEKPLGTGGGLMNAARITNGSDFLVINGDTWFPVDLKKLYVYHTGLCSFITIALKKMTDFSRYGAVECKDGFIFRFNEKKQVSEGLVNGGIYVVNRKLLLSGYYPEVFSIEKDILEKKAGRKELRYMVFDEPFLDIGIPDDYLKAAEIIKGAI